LSVINQALDGGNTLEEKMKELANEVERQREILDGILPGYLRLRDTADQMKNDISDLRRRLRDSNQRYHCLNERHEELSSRVDLCFEQPSESDREDEGPIVLEQENRGPDDVEL
jgi:uncharacterized coiled-coil DUF342 family protein